MAAILSVALYTILDALFVGLPTPDTQNIRDLYDNFYVVAPENYQYNLLRFSKESNKICFLVGSTATAQHPKLQIHFLYVLDANHEDFQPLHNTIILWDSNVTEG